MKIKVKTALLMMLLAVIPASVVTAGQTVIAIAPFTVTSETGIDWMGTGMIDLFTSRLTKDGNVSIIDKTKTIGFTGSKSITRKNAKDTARELGADYLLFGTISESAKGVSLEGLMAPAGKGDILVFSEKSSEYDSADALLHLMNRIVDGIRKEALGQQVETSEEEKPVNQDRNIHAHPDTYLEELGIPKKK